MKNKNELATAPNRKKIVLPKELGLFILLVFLIVGLSILRPDTFATKDNIFNVLRQVSMVAVVAVGQTMVITTSGIDLSVGYSLGLCGIVMTTFMSMGLPPIVCIIAGMLSSIALGFLNGILIAKVKLPAFIATLGVGYMARGVMFIITDGFPIYMENPFVLGIAQAYVGPVPVMVLIMFVVYIIGHYIMNLNKLGMRIRAVGGNETAAKLSGINTDKVKIKVYVLTGVFCAIAGVMMVGRLTAGNPNAGANFDMDSIAAAVVGGTSLAGGEGTIIGTLIGALIMGFIKNGLVLTNVSMYWQQFVIGLIIIIVCILEGLTKRKK